jgi:hypothetical protein
MTTSESLQALRRANPRAQEGFAESVEAAAYATRARLNTPDSPAMRRRARHLRPRRVLGLSAAVGFAAAASAVTLLTVASPGGGPGVVGVEDAAAAVRTAAAVTAESAERSGTAKVHMTRDGEVWAAATIRWNGEDIAIAKDAPERSGKPGHPMLVVGGVLYGYEEDFGWVAFGDPAGIDPDSGTTPAETLAAAREDVGGATLSRILGGMTGLTVREPGDGTTVYSGEVASRLVATETGVKDGESLRVLPFGYVANDEASDPKAQLDVAVTVGENDVVHEIAVAWGVWTYTVTYSGLGSTEAPKAPANARPLSELRKVHRSN